MGHTLGANGTWPETAMSSMPADPGSGMVRREAGSCLKPTDSEGFLKILKCSMEKNEITFHKCN